MNNSNWLQEILTKKGHQGIRSTLVFSRQIQIPLKEPTLGSENDGGLALMTVTSNHTIAMRRNFEFKDYHGRYSKDERDLSVPTIPEINGLCSKVVKLPY